MQPTCAVPGWHSLHPMLELGREASGPYSQDPGKAQRLLKELGWEQPQFPSWEHGRLNADLGLPRVCWGHTQVSQPSPRTGRKHLGSQARGRLWWLWGYRAAGGAWQEPQVPQTADAVSGVES